MILNCKTISKIDDDEIEILYKLGFSKQILNVLHQSGSKQRTIVNYFAWTFDKNTINSLKTYFLQNR